MLAIIGGSGLTQLAYLNVTHREVVRTPYGEPSSILSFGRIGCRDVVFIARHGHGHTIPPHLVNYRANIWALARAAKADGIISVASVGGIRSDLKPGVVVLPHQIIDYTWGRKHTYEEGGDSQVAHVDFTEPYAGTLRQGLLKAAQLAGEPVVVGAVYAATQGPRLETAAEINMIERDGGDIVGMTGMPEASLARELDIPYAATCVVANWCAGRHDSVNGIRFDTIESGLQDSLARVRRIIEHFCTE
jgi:5'-methylthioadenosine phosphorylase